ncbi:MAG: 50S ribosomal protein L35 [Bacilli bacterium]
MPKLKTHKGLKKVVNTRQSGSNSIGHPGSRHNTGSKPTSANRNLRKRSTLSKADTNRLKHLI